MNTEKQLIYSWDESGPCNYDLRNKVISVNYVCDGWHTHGFYKINADLTVTLREPQYNTFRLENKWFIEKIKKVFIRYELLGSNNILVDNTLSTL
jgi:hypothetical protein